MKSAYLIAFFCAAAFAATDSGSTPPLADVLKQLDQSASQFRSMSASVSRVDHTAVLNSDDKETGTVYMKKIGGRVQGLMNTTSPDPKTSAFSGRDLEIYYPAMKQVDIYDTGKNGEQFEQFLTLGFGTSAADLEKNYDIKVLPNATINGEKTIHLQLTPKSAEAKKMISKIDLWIGQGDHNYPVQEQVWESSGNYHLINYSNVQINSPSFKETDVQLKLPSGVKRNTPGK